VRQLGNIAIIADPHFHDFPEFARTITHPVLGTPINSRLNDQLDVFLYVAKRAKSLGADALFINGDLFHVRGSISVDVFQYVYWALEQVVQEYELPVYINTGNHDQMDKAGAIHSIYGLRKLVQVYDTQCIDKIAGWQCGVIPYMSSHKDILHCLQRLDVDGMPDLLFAHIGVDGAFIGPVEYVIKDPVKVEDLRHTELKAVFLGHYHKPQKMADNVWYTGSLTQINRGEIQEVKRWQMLYADGTVKSYKTGCKQFRSITATELLESVNEEALQLHYLDVVIDNPLLLSRVTEVVSELNLHAKIVASRKATTAKARIELNESMSDIDILKEFLKYHNKPEKWIKIGRQLLNSAAPAGSANAHVKLLKVKVRNFMSIGEIELKLDYPGSVIGVVGENLSSEGFDSNGAGKSAFLPESIFWCLYGETARNVPADKVINRKVGRNCEVETTLRIGGDLVKIIRFRKSKEYGGTGVELYVNKGRATLGTTDLTQAEINKKLGIDFKTFSSVVAFSPDALKFVSSTDANQKQILDSILQTRRFTAAGALAKEIIKDVRKDLLITATELNGKVENLSRATATLEEYQREDLDWEKSEKARVSELQEEIGEHNTNIGILDAIIEKYKTEIAGLESQLTTKKAEFEPFDHEAWADIRAKASSKSTEIEANQVSTDQIQSKLDKANNLAGKPCPTCGQAVANTGKMIVAYQRERKTLTDARAKLEAQLVDLNSAVTTMKEQRARQTELTEEIHKLTREIEDKRRQISSAEFKQGTSRAAIAGIQKALDAAPVNPYPGLVAKVQFDVDTLKTDIEYGTKKVSSQQSQVSQLEFWTDVFGNSGVRSFLLDQIIPDLTQYSNEFSSKLSGGSVTIEFQTFKESAAKDKFEIKAWNEMGSDVYGGNSSGEKRRIDLCVMLALFKIAHSRSNINIMLLDETLDTLDGTGLETVLDMIQELARELKLTIYLTSHTGLNKMLHESIVIQKVDGIAKLA